MTDEGLTSSQESARVGRGAAPEFFQMASVVQALADDVDGFQSQGQEFNFLQRGIRRAAGGCLARRAEPVLPEQLDQGRVGRAQAAAQVDDARVGEYPV